MTLNFIGAVKEQKMNLVVFNISFDLPTKKPYLLALGLKIGAKKLLDD